MNLRALSIYNFRKLKKTIVDLEEDITIFVGSNNSGKTSAAHIVDIFINATKDKLSLFDFSSDCWEQFNLIGENGFTEELDQFPTISLDLWFKIADPDIGKVLDLLPGLEWVGTEVGIRVQFRPKSAAELLVRYAGARQRIAAIEIAGGGAYQPWPSSMTNYIERELSAEYEFAYFKLNRSQFSERYEALPDCEPTYLLPETGRRQLKSIIRVDCLDAQRHLSEVNSSGRSEDLSKCLSRFYKRNLEKREEDHDALKALATSEQQLNSHLARVFEGTLSRISTLGYPGFNNPNLVIKSALNPTMIMTQDTQVHYSLEGADDVVTLPDSYNGLGFKNLIYIVVEILDLQNRWREDEYDRSAVHLLFIEEPEAHLHAQLQQVFIRKVFGLLEIEGDDVAAFRSQVVVTTHSSHILYERGFKPIRYFRRESPAGIGQSSVCLNLSEFYRAETEHRDFLEKYLRLTHCDLFFADAAILVEGNVERLLLPLMVRKTAPKLQPAYFSILEVGGAFAFQFRRLIEFLGIATLIITDIDSVHPRVAADEAEPEIEEGEDEIDDEEGEVAGSTCMVDVEGAVTSNQSLVKWLPGKRAITELLEATEVEKTQEATETSKARVYVTYQTLQPVSFGGEDTTKAGRTFEEAFGLENAVWSQAIQRKKLGLRCRPQVTNTRELAERLHRRITGKHFNKTKFALELLQEDEDQWVVPGYIRAGLEWLSGQVILENEEEPIIILGEEAEAV